MNKFLKKSAALALIAVLLATGCTSKKSLEGDTSEVESVESLETAESVESSESGSDSETDYIGTSSDGSASNTSDGEKSDQSSENSLISSSSPEESSTPSTDTNNGENNGGGSNNDGNNNGSGNNGGGNIQTSNKPSGGSVTNGFKVDWKTGNSWEESGKKCGTVELNVVNDSGKAISAWKITFDVPGGFEISSGWSADYSINGTKLTASNLEYNGSIPVGGSIGIGFNYKSSSVFTPPKNVSINGIEGSSSNNGGSNNNQNNNNNQNQNNNNNQNSNDKNQNDPAPTEDVKKLLERSDKAVQGDDWLHTDGNRILDKNGKQVWLTGVNWFGYNTGTNTFDGLWNSQMRGTIKAIADHGFNLIRVPISAELLNQWSRGEYPKANYNNASNPELNDMNSLQIFDYFLKLAEENGMKVMPDIHCAETNAMGHNVNLWYTDKVSVNDYYHALEWLADRYKNNDTIIAIDIKNEPHGKPNEGKNAAIWNDSKDMNNWKYTAEQAAARILAKNPNVLIMVEGTEIYSKKNGNYSSQNSADYYFNWWGGNLRGVRDYPVNLGKYQDKLVYSPHDYGPTVYEQPWFKGGFDYNSLIRDCWQDNWLYIQKEDIAPLLIGEWGGFMKEPNLKWMTCMRKLIKEYHLNHTFWCYNANSGDTGGLVLDDFTTWDTEKYNFVKEVLWQEGGKFVGLDHAIPLGTNGITLSSAKGLQ